MIKADIIRSAVKSDTEALNAVLRYYRPYIVSCSKRSFYDEYGNHYELVDEDMVQQIESKLMYKIICSFDPSKAPKEMLEN